MNRQRAVEIIVYEQRQTRFSTNALLGAVEALPFRDELAILGARGPEELLALLASPGAHRRQLVLISLFTSQLPAMAALLATLRRQLPAGSPGTTLVAGGSHPTGDPAGTLALGFDLVARGEGEATVQGLVTAIRSGQDPRRIPGLAWRGEDGRLQGSGPAAPVDLDRYPPFAAHWRRFGPIEITRGCPFACRYCQTPRLVGRRLRHRSLAVILRHVQVLAARGLDDLRFITPNALSYGTRDPRAVALRAIEALLAGARRIVGASGRIFFGSFPSEVRPEQVSPEAIRLIRTYCDNDNLVIGAQTGSPRLLAAAGRSHSVADVVRAVELAAGAGLVPCVDFIFGLPGETDQDRAASLQLMEKLVRRGARVHGHTFMPLPQTPWARQPPGRLPDWLRARLNQATDRGWLFGSWRQQEDSSRRLADFVAESRPAAGRPPFPSPLTE
ncbi:MAG: TIGR04013 family B12-binding domain/radical SAM domain-containing protein [Thermodesulfobacteriota bacterium]